MKVRIDQAEWWPVYTFSEYGDDFDVPEETRARWRSAFEAFDDLQTEMRKVYETKNPQDI